MKIAEFAQPTLVHRCDGQTDILYYNCPAFNHTNAVQSSKNTPTQKEMRKPNQQLRMRLKEDSKWCTLRRSTQGVLYCQNITRFHSTRVKVTLLTATTEQLRPSENLHRRQVAAGAACTPLQCTGYGSYLIYVLQQSVTFNIATVAQLKIIDHSSKYFNKHGKYG